MDGHQPLVVHSAPLAFLGPPLCLASLPWNFTMPSLVSKNLKVGWHREMHSGTSTGQYLLSVFCYWETRQESCPYKRNKDHISGALIWKSSNRILNAKVWKPISAVLSFPFKAGRTTSWDNTKVFLAVYIDFFFLSLEATIVYYNPKTTNEKSQLRQNLIEGSSMIMILK